MWSWSVWSTDGDMIWFVYWVIITGSKYSKGGKDKHIVTSKEKCVAKLVAKRILLVRKIDR